MKSFFSILLMLAVLSVACYNNGDTGEVGQGYLRGADGAKIFYNVMGTGQDSVVVVHGGPGAGMHSVLPSVKPLAKHYVLIFYDQRGGGKSALPADTTKLQPQYFVEDLEAVRQHFGLKKMNVITHSFGSVLLAQYAKQYPDHLKRLVFHGATGPDLQQELELRKAKAAQKPSPVDTVLAHRSAALLQKLLTGTASDPVKTCRQYEKTQKKFRLAMGDSVTYGGTTCNATAEAISYYYRYTAQLAPRYYNGWNFTEKLQKVNTPLLVIYGKEDSLMIPAQRAWADAVPHGRLLLVPDAGKSAFTDNPNFVFPAVNTFFKGDWPRETLQQNNAE